ncbi:VOC family protein [Shouchella patagoniensis]|uniref:VOC family protein n=1 Tax=Shouchella patagoniensis TaxID=228576 RepID=UPI000995DC06|nr:VOC family protein [Shouchella patagoniensis]
MIKKMVQTTVYVNNLEEAKDFYVNTLGFVVRAEEQFGSDWEYLAISPDRRNETVIELAKASTSEQEKLIGKQGGGLNMMMFETDDIKADYNRLKAQGVIFYGEPQTVPGGMGVGFKDLYGNELDLFEPEK